MPYLFVPQTLKIVNCTNVLLNVFYIDIDQLFNVVYQEMVR